MLALFSIIYITTITALTMKKITPGNPEALCLDGSPSVIYVSSGV